MHALSIAAAILLGTAPLFAVSRAAAFDIDDDGKDDPASVDVSASDTWTWRAVRSSDGVLVETRYGPAGSLAPVPGRYFAGARTLLGFVSTGQFWTIQLDGGASERVNFGRDGVTYLSGHDFDGDGISDFAKFLNRCNEVTEKCAGTPVTGNFLLNPFSDGAIADTGVFGRGNWQIFAMDGNGDGKDDVCYAKPNARRAGRFRIECTDLETAAKVRTQPVKELFGRPLGLETGDARGDTIVLYRITRKATEFEFFAPGGVTERFTLPETGTVLVGNWLGETAQQVGVAHGDVLTVRSSVSGATRNLPQPEGMPIGSSLFIGPNERMKLTTPLVMKNRKKLGM